MSKNYPDYDTPTMIYNALNQWTIIDATDLDAFLAAGWKSTPGGDIYTAPTEYQGTLDLPPAAPAPKMKPKPQTQGE